MKKPQYLHPLNKSKLNLNHDMSIKKSRLVINYRPLKQNSTSLKRKEEKMIKRQEHQYLPSLKSITNKISQTTTSKDSQEIGSKQIIQSKHCKKTLDLLSLRKNQQAVELSSQMVRTHAKQFLQLLLTKNIIESKLDGIFIFTCNFQIILHYIITLINNKEQQNSLLINLKSQESLNRFLALKSCEVKSQGKVQNLKKLGIVSNVYQLHICEIQTRSQSTEDEISRLQVLKENVLNYQKIKQQIGCRIVQAQQNLTEIQRNKDQLNQKSKYLFRQNQRLLREIEKNTKILQNTQDKKNELQNFVKSQKNKIVIQASEYHKNIQLDMFEYEDYLRHHPLGKKQYLHSIYYTEISRLAKQQIDKFSFLQKDEKSINSFNLIKHQYGLMIEELHHAIDEKTKFIQEFCRIVFLWYENYLAKTEFLGNLKKAFAIQVINVEKCSKKFCLEHESQTNKCQHCGMIRMELKKLLNFVDKMAELFGMGNSFY